MKLKNKLILLLLANYALCSAMMKEYGYKRQLVGISDGWYNVELPNDIFAHTNSDLSDLRIYGITSNNDTIEAPYILTDSSDKLSRQNYSFEVFNQSYQAQANYFSFDNKDKEIINQIELVPVAKTYDWKIQLEGSDNQQEWFNILDDYRIFSIKVDEQKANFHYSTLKFPQSNYRYYRLCIKTAEKVELKSISMSKNEMTAGKYQLYSLSNIKETTDKKEHITLIDIDLDAILPVSKIKVPVADKIDYNRSIEIQYLSDSIKTERGWHAVYTTVVDDYLNSNAVSEYTFKTFFAKKIKIKIYNKNNPVLHLEKPLVYGVKYSLMARFTELADYYLCYGNKDAYSTSYDIEQFVDKLPDSIPSVKVGEEQIITPMPEERDKSFSIDETWLWIVMSVIIILLAVFSLKMIKSKKD